MSSSEGRTKVFISCGQRTPSECEIARNISTELNELGYEPYIAVLEQTLEGLKNNVFWQLETSEYFLFIDFWREEIIETEEVGESGTFKPKEYRGSLFTNQELAIASYLRIDAIGFQEVGIKKLDGMLSVMQLNVTTFDDRSALVANVIEKIRSKWNPDWKDRLKIDLSLDRYHDADPGNGMHRHYFLAIRNEHNRRIALDCQVFPLSVLRVNSGEDLLKEPIELKWTGSVHPDARIRPRTARKFDALIISHARPTSGHLHGHTDAGDYVTWLIGKGEYEIEYEVTSANFRTERAKFRVTINDLIDDTTIELIDE